MARYLLTFHEDGIEEGDVLDDVDQVAWTCWLGGLGSALVEAGERTGRAVTIGSGDHGNLETETAGSHGVVTGYTVVDVSTLDAAVHLARSCPALERGRRVQVAELHVM